MCLVFWTLGLLGCCLVGVLACVLMVGVVCLLLAWLWCLFFGFVGCLGDAFGGLVDFGCDLVYYGVLVGCCFRLTLN